MSTPLDPSLAAAVLDTRYGRRAMDALILMNAIILLGTPKSVLTAMLTRTVLIRRVGPP